jgi:hypothetical protein
MNVETDDGIADRYQSQNRFWKYRQITLAPQPALGSGQRLESRTVLESITESQTKARVIDSIEVNNSHKQKLET